MTLIQNKQYITIPNALRYKQITMNQISNSLTRQIFFILVILSLVILIFWNLKTFIPSFLGAYTLYILLRKPMSYLTITKKWPKGISAIILMIISMILFLFPMNALIQILGKQSLPYLQNSQNIYIYVQKFIHDLEVRYGVEIMTQDNIGSVSDWLVQEGRMILSATLNSLGLVVILYFILYFLLTNGKNMERKLLSFLPLNDTNTKYFRKNLQSLVFSNAVGVPLVSLFQSLVALLGYWIAGVDEPFLWFVVTFLVSFVPFLGAMLVYIPLAFVLIYNGHVPWGVFLLLYGFIIVGSVDNIFRFWLLKKIGDTHPLITIFGVIVGLKLFGFIGLIFGPILISLLVLLIDLYNQEYSRTEEN